jgi:hypothetical protein
MSHEEKVKMYDTIEKYQLIEMLIEANLSIDRLTPHKICTQFQFDIGTRTETLCKCGKDKWDHYNN